MFKDENYQAYSNTQIKDVPVANIQYLLKLFLYKAAMNMGAELNDKTTDGAIEITQQHYWSLPVCYVASGIIKGSLGHYGEGRLCPRTVYKWLNEISIEYNRQIASDKRQSNATDIAMPFDLAKYPIGKAIIQKISWYQEGKLNGDKWDNVDLRQLTEDIGAGKSIRFENYK